MNRILSGLVVACLVVAVVAGCRGGGQIYNVILRTSSIG